MIPQGAIRSIARRVDQRFKKRWDDLRAEFSAARDSGESVDLVAFAKRAETLAGTQADASVNAIRPLLIPMMATPDGRRLVNAALSEILSEALARLVPMTATAVAEKLADAAAADDEVDALFAAALEENHSVH